MLKKDDMLTGVLIAFVFPVIAWLTGLVLKYNVYLINRPAVPYFAAAALNLLLLRFFLKKEADQTGRGIMLATFTLMLLFFVFKIQPLR